MNLSSDFTLNLIFLIQVCPCEMEFRGKPVAKIMGKETETCPICLKKFKTQDVGIPDCCSHTFCCI
jgi:hypothetical protein